MLHVIKRHQLEMVLDRGYSISEIEEDFLDNPTEEKFKEIYGSDPEVLLGESGTLSRIYDNSLFVMYSFESEGKQLSQAIVTRFVGLMGRHGTRYGVLLSQQKLAQQAGVLFERMATPYAQHFTFDELMVNRSRHFEVPSHTILSKDESDRYLQDNKIKASQLPRIHLDDPQVKYLGGVPGQVVRIARQNLWSDALIPNIWVHRLIM